MDKWTIIYTNDTGPCDDYFEEWWEVSNGVMTFRAEKETWAKWLRDRLNQGK